MTVRQIQWGIAAVFFILGGWALVAPRSVIELTFLPEYRPGPGATGATGAAATLPFFAFNWWFTFVEPVFTWLGLLDAVGNVVMLGLCVLGWRKAGAHSSVRNAATKPLN